MTRFARPTEACSGLEANPNRDLGPRPESGTAIAVAGADLALRARTRPRRSDQNSSTHGVPTNREEE
jgi:hypothetical protein